MAGSVDLAALRKLHEESGRAHWTAENADADGRYLIAAANALPALLDIAEAALEVRDTMRSMDAALAALKEE